VGDGLGSVLQGLRDTSEWGEPAELKRQKGTGRCTCKVILVGFRLEIRRCLMTGSVGTTAEGERP